LIKSFLLTLFISRGVPMLLGGDEFRRTQQGNNNAYCQDNAVSWIPWSFLEKNREIHRFARGMIAFRRAHPVLRKAAFYTDADIRWFGPQGTTPAWADPDRKSVACLILGRSEPDLFLMFNADTTPRDFSIPTEQGNKIWRLAVDTSRPAPEDLYEAGEEPSMHDRVSFRVEPRSSAILLSHG
jgi:isoamylase